MKNLALCAVAFVVLFCTTSATSKTDEDVQLLEYIFQTAKHLPKVTSAPRSEKYPEIGLGAEELIQLHGYPSETHEVTTEDGYVLSLHRIPHGLADSPGRRPVVFLMHGLFGSSTCFVFNGIDKSLGLLLAEQGYDVWMGNARGSTYSRKHARLDPDDDKCAFWDFSWHEIGYYDLPASIDYILQETNQEGLIYIGHSQGTTTFYVMASERPEYNEKIKLAVSLAPIGFMANIPSESTKQMAKNLVILELLVNGIEFYEMLPQWQIYALYSEEVCSDGSPTQEFCIKVINTISGKNEKELNTTRLPVYFSQIPAGASVKQMYHYGQEINSGHFRKYDYGFLKNLIKYGTLTPPDYKLENIVAPMALYYSKNDAMSGALDVEELYKRLPNVVELHLMEDDEFAHFDYLTAIDVNELLYDRLFALLKQY